MAFKWFVLVLCAQVFISLIAVTIGIERMFFFQACLLIDVCGC